MENYKIGDILFFEFKPDKWYHRLMERAQSYFDNTPFHHVAIYIGNGCISEMDSSGLRRGMLLDSDKFRIESVTVDDIDKDRLMKIIDEYEKMEEKEYPKLDLLQVGFRVMMQKVFRLDVPMLHDFKGRICTDYVRDIYMRYGIEIGESNLSVGELWRELQK